MSRFAYLASVSLLLAIACSAPKKSTAPGAVDPKQVKGIVMLEAASSAEACSLELARLGVGILYRNEMGVLFVDKAPADFALSTCRATVMGNDGFEVGHGKASEARNGEDVDLSTLLRLIPAEEIGARSFVKDHPTFDGRNVVVGILDTGVEVDHPMLRKTSNGEDKVIDFNDMSGEGRVELLPAKIEGGVVSGADGTSYTLTGTGTGVHRLGLFKGSTLAQTELLSTKDTFSDLAVVAYQGADGKWRARIDTNNDKNFDDEKELADYSVGLGFTKIGAKKSLSVSVNFAPDAVAVNLCFDDGSHGTHVAGISTGYDPSGLQGVAPGAKVVAVKIGDNRLAGGSTTTASMMLAIDYAVQKGVNIINMSYGIRAGSNIGASAIDKYVDKVAKEKGILFSISAGNEGPGLLTVGTPAGANLAITNAAYISRQTARDNYGYVGVEDDNTWYFSSVGPRLDGGWKPSLLAPGTALSSVPLWDGSHANYRGTSMASPEVTGGLALILSAAKGSGLPTSRAAITSAVYASARPVANLAWVEQGHGLMSVPGAVSVLAARKAEPVVEYAVTVNNGTGIYLRSRTLGANVYTVKVTPSGDGAMMLRTFKLVASDAWIRVPTSFWLSGAANSFQVALDSSVLASPGLHSGKIAAIDEKTGITAFELPVTVVAPALLNDSTGHRYEAETKLKVGQTLRYFLDVPAGTTAIAIDLVSDGPMVWGQLLDNEGRKVKDLRDAEATAPQPPIYVQANLTKPGVYELDIVAPPSNPRPAVVRLRAQAYSLGAAIEGYKPGGAFNVQLTNAFEPTKVVPKLELRAVTTKKIIDIKGGGTQIPFSLAAGDVKDYEKIRFNLVTAKEYYDLMTDYPYRVFDKDGKVALNGGLELSSDIELTGLDKLTLGDFRVDIQGAFTEKAPDTWAIKVTQERVLKNPVTLFTGKRLLLESGDSTTIGVPATEAKGASCVTLTLADGAGRTIQETPVCE